MKEPIVKQLKSIQLMVRELSDSEYAMMQSVLFGATIGQHVRHILEFYLCLTESVENGVLSFDNRRRDIRIETNRVFADQLIDSILKSIQACVRDQPLKLWANFSTGSTEDQSLDTSLFRELAYNLEHGTHHQALIKIGVRQLGRGKLLGADFGVAPATIRYQLKNIVHT